ITNVLVNLIQGVISLVTVIFMLFNQDFMLASLTLTVIPLIIYTSKRLGNKVKPLSMSIRQQMGFITAMINESIAGMTIIKLFQLEKHASKMFDHEQKKLVKNSVKETGMRASNSLMIGLLFLFQFVLVVALGSVKVFQGTMTPGALISFILYADMIAGPISLISGIYLDTKSTSASIDRLQTILKTDDIVQSQPAHFHTVEKGEIEFENVHFAYKPGQIVLNDISFHIAPGMTVAFVGKSGAGKSTVLKLLPRFYVPQGGDIKIDGVRIQDYHTVDLRKHIAIVPQESFLFGMSIKDNILCGKPDASDEQVIEAAKKANAHDFIMALPQGYETIAGERGANLSGGQRQRIAIARAFIKSPKILLLDEATSALDNETQAEVQQALNRLMKDRTVIVIAHRLSTVMHADIIFVMDQGKIIEQGTHSELMATSLLYRNLYQEYSAKAV
ncbi:MAG TPA: ABC transporter ATP-binding protein, partial [Clostridiales bacterium]|nr:ABC transporter ATP-binding protein [Clostridiales bacterium]